MRDIRSLAHRLKATWLDATQHLSATQRLTLRGAGLMIVILLVGTIVGGHAPRAVASSGDGIAYTGTIRSEFLELRQTLDTTSGELELVRLRLQRVEAIVAYSEQYQVPADLVALIYDTALRQGMDPELAFRLVAIESAFTVGALSRAGALGLIQVQLGTARFYEPGITADELLDPATNLRIGLRYLHHLIRSYGDTELALLAYNRGPARVEQLLSEGLDPRNGYAASVMDGYRGIQ